jgi:hypothetical protein
MATRDQYIETWFTGQMKIPAARVNILDNHDPGKIPEDRIPRYLLEFGVEE